MSAPARSTPPILPMRAHAPNETDPRLEVIRLKRDNASLRLRVRSYRRALAEVEAKQPLTATSALEFGPASTLLPLLTMARQGEWRGRAPLLRFSRDADDQIIGVELLFLRPGSQDDVDFDAPLDDEMAVIDGAEG